MNGAITKIKKMFIQKRFFCFSPMNIKIKPIHITKILIKKRFQFTFTKFERYKLGIVIESALKIKYPNKVGLFAQYWKKQYWRNPRKIENPKNKRAIFFHDFSGSIIKSWKFTISFIVDYNIFPPNEILFVERCEKNNAKNECEKQESNLRTPARIDLESIPVDHLGILARNNIGFRIVKGFEFWKRALLPNLVMKSWVYRRWPGLAIPASVLDYVGEKNN